MKRHITSQRDQSGFSLIEVLVTLIVVALGLLGFASLQAYSLKSNRTALQRSYATMLSYDIIDCMRVNRVGADADEYDIEIGTPATAGTVAGDDLVAWKDALKASLPGGDGQVIVNNRNVTVNVQWKENLTSSRTLTFKTETSLW